MPGRYTTLIMDPTTHTAVERLRRLRIIAALRERLAEDVRAVTFPVWLAEQPPDCLARAAAGLVDLDMAPLAQRLRALAPRDVKASPVAQLLGLPNEGILARVEVGQALQQVGPELARRTADIVARHGELQPDAALPEVETAPPGHRRWRVPAVVSGGLPGVAAATDAAAQRLGFTRAEMRTRLEDRVRGEVGVGLGFDWVEPFQCHQTMEQSVDPEPPLGAVPGDLIIRPVPPPSQAIAEAFNTLLGETSPLKAVVRAGQLILVDDRTEVFEARLWALGNSKRPKTRPERVAWRVWSVLHLLRGVGLAACLEGQGHAIRQAAQGFEVVGLPTASRLLHRLAVRLAPEGVVPEEVDWAARVADLSTLGRVRFGLFEWALRDALQVGPSVLFDYLEANRWRADEV